MRIRMMRVWMAQAMAAALGCLMLASCGSEAAGPMKEVMAQDAGGMRIELLSKSGELAQGENQFRMTFSEAGKPVDAGSVTVSSSMSMPGMPPMVAPMELTKAAPGEYAVHSTFDMSGSWKFDVQWEGPSGKGGTSFRASVR